MTLSDSRTANPGSADSRAADPAATAIALWADTPTPDGPFTVVTDATGAVLASGWTHEPEYLIKLVHRSLRPTDLYRSADVAPLIDTVRAYYDGDLAAPAAVPVTQRGGPFLQRAWAALRTVPAGAPVTYTRLAELAGEPAAVRAAATSCARNAAALFVPCHRVIRRDGSLGGFRYGLATKHALLDREVAAGTA